MTNNAAKSFDILDNNKLERPT